jgi:mercuric ion binding protein
MNRALGAVGFTVALLAGGAALAGERTVTLAVDNMYCDACPYIVQQSLARVDGVSQAAVSFEKKTATVTFDDAKTTLAALTAATTKAGYPSRAIR